MIKGTETGSGNGTVRQRLCKVQIRLSLIGMIWLTVSRRKMVLAKRHPYFGMLKVSSTSEQCCDAKT